MDDTITQKTTRRRARSAPPRPEVSQDDNTKQTENKATRHSTRKRSRPKFRLDDEEKHSEISGNSGGSAQVSTRSSSTTSEKAKSVQANGSPRSRSQSPRLNQSIHENSQETVLENGGGIDVVPEETLLSLDAGATLLARLDERSFQRAMLSDANGVASELLVPLSLPWVHKGIPVARNIPCDLDDMTEILMADDGSYTPFSNGPLGFGRFDTGQFRSEPVNRRLATSEDSWCLASRRTTDPGVIEISSVTLPPNRPDTRRARANMEMSKNLTQKSFPCGGSVRGDVALRYFEQTWRRKRRCLDDVQSCTERRLISVRVNSTSTRSSIFTGITEGESFTSGCFLEATLPQEVQQGRFLNATKAQEVADELGTYNWRHSLATPNQSGKNANRLGCGRTRKMWTEKIPSEQPQKVFYKSILTGQRIESGTQKRPREIKVALRVNGQILGSVQKPDVEQCVVNDPFNFSDPPERLGQEDHRSSSQQACLLRDDLFVRTIFSSRDTQMESSDAEHGTFPVLDCLPDATGTISVICSRSGKLNLTDIHKLLKESSLGGTPVCTVCWSDRNDKICSLETCGSCGICVHQSCSVGGAFSSRSPNQWYCHSCKKEDAPVLDGDCLLCRFTGGSRSPVAVGDKTALVHDVCRIWLGTANGQLTTVPVVPSDQFCALCGETGPENGTSGSCRLLKCAASRCQVYFHPMCVVVANKLTLKREGPSTGGIVLDETGKEDVENCKHFSLTFLECEYVGNPNSASQASRKLLPIGFCGLHIPTRKKEYRGLYPGGMHINRGNMFVPSGPILQEGDHKQDISSKS
eukprot:Nitzschia sp. Nitz4//scaffold40_size135432//33646//36146//NITZ4_003234-RA/size135432-exonerate_est2genome-gene-0.142-mRNA-1//-1//CDS//3329551189//3441//frame0